MEGVRAPSRPVHEAALGDGGHAICRLCPARCFVRPCRSLLMIVRSRCAISDVPGLRRCAARRLCRLRGGQFFDIAVRQSPSLACRVRPKRPVARRWRLDREVHRCRFCSRRGYRWFIGKHRQHTHAHKGATGHDHRCSLEESGHVGLPARNNPPGPPLS